MLMTICSGIGCFVFRFAYDPEFRYGTIYSNRYSEVRFNRLEIGMPSAEVAAIMGRLRGVGLGVRRDPCQVLIFSGCNSHPATGSLQPVAIGAAVEVTKPSEPSRQMCRFGDAASRQAVTRVNVEQASKRPMWVPTRQNDGEGCRRWG